MMMLIGSLWNMHAPSYGQFMVSRILQSFAWGAFDTLVVVSVRDVFFVSISRVGSKYLMLI